jgi:uncharacterized protein
LEVKKRRDSIEQFEKGGRPELATKEKQEIAVLEDFLPQQLSASDLEKLVRDAIAETGATSKKEMGPGQSRGARDGKSISQIVGKLLP